jgi:hypothetical protein
MEVVVVTLLILIDPVPHLVNVKVVMVAFLVLLDPVPHLVNIKEVEVSGHPSDPT